jgi:anaphase-promoting complex subunit 2
MLYSFCFNLQKAENGSPELSCSFSEDPKESRRQAMTAAVMGHADANLLRAFQKLFGHSLLGRQERYDTEVDDENQEDELTLFANLRTLGWIRKEGMLQQPLGEALHHTILTWVRNAISKEFEEEGLFEQVQEYQEQIVLPWLHDLVGAEHLEADNWPSRIQYSCAECFCLVRMEEIFDLVADYPDSHPAVMELKQVLERTKMHPGVGEALKQSLIKRLNHPGANTSQIIDVYINTIKVLREIDPSDRLLQVVAEPVRSYLRRRHNTVRCIITSLTDAEVGGELYEELRRQDARPLEHNIADSDDEEEPPDFDWQPPPPISKPKGTFFGSGTKGGGGDILSMLVSIYGSKELFVNEYRLMLADKLLANLEFNTDKEVHTLELLKLRFGELSMRNCEIMIKDTDDSKRVINNIHNTLKTKRRMADEAEAKTDPLVNAAIVSHIFWPTLQNEQFKHHPRLQAGLDEFGSEFARLKNPRRLVWMNQLGTVQLELDVLEEKADGTMAVETREFSVAPLLATLISHFEDKEEWTAEELSNETGIPEHMVQKRMGYWVNHRVIQLQPPATYVVATRDHLLEGDIENHGVAMDEDCHEDQAVSVAAQEEEEMEVYESYIAGMLKNIGQLPLERIHNMLKMFVTGSDMKYNKTPQQLSMFLQHLCKQEKLECGPDGMYKLLKK